MTIDELIEALEKLKAQATKQGATEIFVSDNDRNVDPVMSVDLDNDGDVVIYL